MSRNDRNKEKKHIHVVLYKKRQNKFYRIKNEYNINSDVDVVRLCIDEMFRKLDDKDLILNPFLKKQLTIILKNEYLRNRYLVQNMNDILNDALREWILTKRSEINLHHLGFRQALNKEEQIIANFLIKHNLEKQHGISMDEISQNIKSLSNDKIKTILQRFTESGLINVNQVKGIDYYFVSLP